MKKEYDFSNARRGVAVPQKGKTRITIYLDDAVIEDFRALSAQSGKGYQTLINDALREKLARKEPPVTTALVRKIVREELSLHA
jgi:uncharacterized protein (DUF4415 family)